MSTELTAQAFVCASRPEWVVVYATTTPTIAGEQLRQALEELRGAGADDKIDRVVLSHGHQEIRFKNGSRLMVRSPHSRGVLRGMSADRVILELVRDEAFEADARIVTAVRGGQVVRIEEEPA